MAEIEDARLDASRKEEIKKANTTEELVAIVSGWGGVEDSQGNKMGADELADKIAKVRSLMQKDKPSKEYKNFKPVLNAILRIGGVTSRYGLRDQLCDLLIAEFGQPQES